MIIYCNQHLRAILYVFFVNLFVFGASRSYLASVLLSAERSCRRVSAPATGTHSSRKGTVVRGHSDTDELSLPA